MSMNLQVSIIRGCTYKFSVRVGWDRNNGAKRHHSWSLKITGWEKEILLLKMSYMEVRKDTDVVIQAN